MNKKESQIILNTYKQIYFAHTIVNIDKSDTIREFKFMLDNLGLKKERYIVENNIIAERDELTGTVKECYIMIFETFTRYGKYINYDLKEIQMYYDNLQYEFTEEDVKCHNARIKYILDRIAA